MPAKLTVEVSPSNAKPRINTTYYNNCTLARLTDELTLRLSSYCDCTIFHDTENREYLLVHRPYQDRADRIVHRVHVYEKTPIFVINEKHLPQALIYELKKLGPHDMDIVITEAVRRIYESADFDYFHKNGVNSKIVWGFED
jgi:hypothetical protein